MVRVLIGVSTAEMARRAAFYDYLHTIQQPVGTITTFVHGQSIAHNRNLIVKQAIDNGCSHVFFLDDDVAMPRDGLIKLICHNVDMVTGLQLARNYPHRPLIFDEIYPDGLCRFKHLSDDDNGLMKIAASGLGCCLMKCKVFSKLEEPWFRFGEVDKDGLGEDLGFFRRADAIGLELHCDLNVLVGHMASMIVWPEKVNSKWMTVYDTSGEDKVYIQQPTTENSHVGAH